jgi:hypothetical protein
MLFVSNTDFIDFSFFPIAKKFIFNVIFINTTQINCVRIIIALKLINWEIVYQTVLTGLIRKTVIFIK